MYLAPGSYVKAAEIISFNLELGAFLHIEPVFAEKYPTESEGLIAFKRAYSL